MKMKYRGFAMSCCLGLLMVFCAYPVSAETMTISSTTGSWEGTAAYEGQAASATFTLNDEVLTITLSNISTWAISHQTQVLTGLFFSISNVDSSLPDLTNVFDFTPLSGSNSVTGATAVIAPGSAAYSGDTALSSYSDVGGEWGFKEDVDLSATETAGYGIGASGLDPIGFGPWDRFNKNTLTSPAAPGGADWGLRSNIMPSTQTTGLLNQNPLISNAVIFTFSIDNSAFSSLTQIHDVLFYYGTNATEGRLQGDDTAPPSSVPEPTSFLLMTLGIVGIGLRRIR